VPACRGAVITGSTYCAKSVPDVNRENLLQQAKLGRIATYSAIAEARRSATHTKHVEALRKWNPSDLPNWLDEIHSEGDLSLLVCLLLLAPQPHVRQRPRILVILSLQFVRLLVDYEHARWP
jgi:hypothetical protein